jgi:hypothetical protein
MFIGIHRLDVIGMMMMIEDKNGILWEKSELESTACIRSAGRLDALPPLNKTVSRYHYYLYQSMWL